MGTETLTGQNTDNELTMESAVEYLNNTPYFTKKSSLDTIREYLRRFGEPERGMKIIHVAGTNGKGSVCSFLSSCLREAGFSVGLFVSPHLITIRERMSIDGEMITEEEFLSAFVRVLREYDAAKEEGLPHPLYFEFLFLMAMLWFSEKSPDYLILETGLGGRLDATNALPDKEVAVITRIGLDHTAILGNTLTMIGGEKAGILREGCPAVFLDEPEEAYRTIKKKAEEIGAPAYIVSRSDWEILGEDENGIDFSLRTRYHKNLRARIPARAPYQCENAALAAAAYEILLDGTGADNEKALLDGLSKSFWPGRMEEILPDVWIDGAHNPDGIRAFLESAERICAVRKAKGAPEKCFLLFSCVKDKQYSEELDRIAGSGLFTDIVAVPMTGKRALGADELTECMRESAKEIRIHTVQSVREAVDRFIIHRESDTLVFTAGSLYLIGEIREQLLKEIKV